MNPQEYDRILKKYAISGNPSLIELRNILRKKIKEYHPDKYSNDPNYLNYQEKTRDIISDYDIIHNALQDKNASATYSQPSYPATNEPEKTLDDLKKDAAETIEKLKKAYEKDATFNKDLDIHAENFKKCQNREEFIKENNRLKRDLLFKRKLKFSRLLSKDNNEYGDDFDFFYNIYAEYSNRLERLDESDPSVALSELSIMRKEYNTTKQRYLNNLSKANSSRNV